MFMLCNGTKDLYCVMLLSFG